MDTNQINIEIAVFLRRLRMYSEQKNLQISDKTTEMLFHIILNIDKLMANAEIVTTSEPNNANFIFDLNEKQFDLRQYIMCRLCVVRIDKSGNTSA